MVCIWIFIFLLMVCRHGAWREELNLAFVSELGFSDEYDDFKVEFFCSWLLWF